MSDLVSEYEDTESIRPRILHEGRYRLYLKPDGNYHLVYKRDDREDEEHQEIPGALLRLAEKAGSENMSFPQFMMEAMKVLKSI